MAYNANSTVKIAGVSKAELNDQIATIISGTTGANGMPRYVVELQSSGERMSLAPKNLIPIAGSDDGGQFGGMPANIAGLMQALPPWFKEKLARGEKPDLDDLKRLLGVEVSTFEIGVIVASFVLLYFKLGIIKALIITCILSYTYMNSVNAYRTAGGGVAGVKASGLALSKKLIQQIRTRLGYELSPSQSYLLLGGLLVGIFAIVAQSLVTNVPPSSATFYDDDLDDLPSQTRSSSMVTKLQAAYDEGYLDGSLGTEKKKMTYEPPQVPPRKQFFTAPPGPPPQAAASSFGIGKVINLGYIAKNIYDLGGRPFNAASIPVNFQAMGTMQKVFLGFMVARVFGMSPI